MYDVIVAGAGPAGSAAARTLAAQGWRVLLVERCKMPRYKSCSGMLIRKTLELVELYFGKNVPHSVTCAPAENRGMIFTNDIGEEYRFAQPGLNVWRSAFDHWLAEQAAACGAEVRDGMAVAACTERDGCVEVRLRGGLAARTETACYVLDCGGVTDAHRRRLRGIRPEYIVTFQTFNIGSVALDPHYFYAYLQPELSQYDAWMNVKDNLLVLGVAVRDMSSTGAYYERFLAYMRQRHQLRLMQQQKAEKWLMPRVLPGCPIDHGQGRILFAGEAAGFLNPMGEGISAALESGYHAACAIGECFGDPQQVLRAYEGKTEPLHAYMKRQWRFVGEIGGTFREMRAGT